MKSMMGVILVLLAAAGGFKLANANVLTVNHYDTTTCPQAIGLIQLYTSLNVSVNPGLAAQLLRMHFHDCFVRGCDGSALLYKANHTAERDGFPNANSLKGFEFISYVKGILESIPGCSKTVSCADVIALTARDAVQALYPATFYWDVLLGRSDGNYSFDTEANVNLPPPSLNYTQLIGFFRLKGLTENQTVILSAAHTIGTANCTVSNNRLYNFDGHGNPDPALNSTYLQYLRAECPQGITNKRIAMKDQTGNIFISNNATFDNYYFKNVQKRMGLFSTDDALMTNSHGANLTNFYANNAFQFQLDFNSAMQALGNIEIKYDGHIRVNCSDPSS